MPDRWLWRKLVLPLGTGALTLLALHFVVPFDGWWLNLSASFVAIVVTILYVDRILERHDQLKWSTAAELISQRILLTCSGNITNLRGALDIPPMSVLSTSPGTIQRDYLDHSASVVEPAIASHVRSLDVAGWKKLATGIRACYTNCENVLSLFGAKLDPKELELLIATQNHLRSAVLPYEAFPDLLGLPDDQMPQTKPDPRPLRDQHTQWATEELEAAVKTSRELGQYVLGKRNTAA